jgi:hypothetical protein
MLNKLAHMIAEYFIKNSNKSTFENVMKYMTLSDSIYFDKTQNTNYIEHIDNIYMRTIRRLIIQKYDRWANIALNFKQTAKKYRATHVIVSTMEKCYLSPYTVIGRKRLMRDFEVVSK